MSDVQSRAPIRSVREFHERYFPNTLFVGDRVRDTFAGREGRIKLIVGRVAVVEGRGPSLEDWWTADIPLPLLKRVPLSEVSRV